jgi:hypothetical protein
VQGAARLIEAFCYVFGATVRCAVFTTLDGLEAVAKRFR